ncbi:HTH-type transcriptional activator IlvY [Psychrobium sp. 1_MG-2023]|uniref:HTH-type transcriptional activator IlvY n=1 Tax=Psychrobium sp. 1_MG-2023 TaxID=3062624 RepID=UPI000C3221EC|nr:HTH-type transcriptional activator IlvY [Psychrobium sp. 1_MG-2023]MDP2561078.1 HTH-type transcriptional activator IlvY [Psychrobium sp. 1_MG-2023]PKF58397.1 HTH-type transcriptional activator IlvY [Alteromonadales bacterium alter-6D02]
MDNRQLKMFLALADSLHFAQASAQCHVSPSTLSRNIQQLEQQLDVTLFERDNRTVNLTRQGELFVQYAKATLAQWDVFKSSLETDSHELQGELSIYCSVTASHSFLHQILARYRQQYPKVEIKIRTGDVEQSIPRIHNECEDMSIAAKPDQLPPNMAFQTLGISPLVFIAPVERCEVQALIDSGQYNWNELPLIVPEQGLARKRLDQWFKRKNIRPRIYSEVAGNEAIVSMVSLGFGVGLVPKIVLDNSPLKDSIQIVEATPQLKPFEVVICCLKKRLKNPLINSLWTAAKEGIDN